MKICDNFGLFNCSINCGDNSWLFLLLLFILALSVTISNLASFFFWKLKFSICYLALVIFFRSFDTFLLPLWLLFFIIFYTRKRVALSFHKNLLFLFYISNFQWKCFIKIVLVLFPIKWSNSNIDVVAYYTEKRLMNKRHWLGCLKRIYEVCVAVETEIDVLVIILVMI